MGYYRGDNYGCGDYYRGDYYRGDPGLLGGLGKLFKSAVTGFATGGPFGALTAVGRQLVRPTPQISASLMGGGMAPVAPAGVFAPTVGGFELAPGQVGGIQQPVGTMLPSGFIPGCQLKGTRPNKSGYYKQVIKGNPAQVVYIPKGSVCVKSRRLNVANPRALRRAIRRARGFSKLARRVLSFVQAKAPKGKAVFKKKK